MKKIFTLFAACTLALVAWSQQIHHTVEFQGKKLYNLPLGYGEERAAGNCSQIDTITTYFDRGTNFFRLTAGSNGYVFGTSSLFSETAVHYSPVLNVSRVTEVMCYFTDKAIVGQTDSLEARVYTAANDSMPATLLGSGKVSLADVDTAGFPTFIPINNAATFSGQFLVSIFHGGIDDTVALFSNNVLTTMGGPDGNQEKRVRQYRTSSSTWTRAWDFWNIAGAPLDADAIVMPIVCQIACSGPPNTAFSSSTSSLAATFTDQTTGDPPASWLWDFGDGNTSSQQNPMHTYAAPGSYTVCLTTTNACGSDSSCQSVTVTCSAPSAAWTHVDNGLGNVDFTDGSTSGPGVTSWLWDFGDGFTSTQQNPNHQYPAPGTYLVCLTVTDICGSDSSCMSITIANCPATMASWTFMDNGNGNVSFTDGSSTTGSTTWLWDFGDGNNSPLPSPTHNYIANGTYLVCLTVTDSCGTDSMCQSIPIIVSSIEAGLGDLRVYPNPSAGQFVISGELSSLEPVYAHVYDMLGKELHAYQITTRSGQMNVQLNLEGTPVGVYYLRLRQGDQQVVRKLIVE